MMTDKDSSAAGTDNRPPMLEENDYESWRIPPEGGAVPPPRNKRNEEFTEEDNRNELPDIQIINILSIGLLRLQRRAPGNTGTKGIQTTASAKGKGAVLDAEAEAFLADVECTAAYDQPLALTTTNLFKANHKDAYDSDVDEGPHASVAFMVNLSSTGGINGSSSSHINEVQISDDSFFSDVSYPLAQEMQQQEHLNSEVDSVLDDNMITYDEYQNDSKVKAVPTVALECNKVKHDLNMAIVERNKRNAELKEENVMLKSTFKSKVVSIENIQQESKQVLSKKKTLEDTYLEEIVVLTNANKVATNVLKGFQMPTHTIPMLSKRPNFASHDLHKTGLVVPQKEFSREQVYWLPAAKIASQPSTPAKPVAPFVHTRPVKSDVHKK
nr:hypothetical protein [Tanacetum cinerariifolium]